MNILPPFDLKRLGLTWLAVPILTVTSAQAAVVWQETFLGEAEGATPSSDYTGNSVEDWVVTNGVNANTNISGSVGNPLPSLHLLDTTTTASAGSSVSMGQFSAFNTTNPSESTMIISFDFRVDSFSTAAVASTPQFFLRDGGATRLTIGFGQRSIADGDAFSDLFLFAGAGSGPSPSATNAIGYTGAGWTAGFDFGNTSATASDNNTDGNFINFELTYTNAATTASLLVTHGANSTVFTITGLTASSYSSTALDSLNFSSGSSATAEAYFDNIQVQVVPEPSPSFLVAITILGCLFRRRSCRLPDSILGSVCR